MTVHYLERCQCNDCAYKKLHAMQMQKTLDKLAKEENEK